jgi:signal transduction histidine kinase
MSLDGPIEVEPGRGRTGPVRREPRQTRAARRLAPVRPVPALGVVAGQRFRELVETIRDDLGFETASLFVRGPDGWRLLERRGPERSWHGVLDPTALEGTPEAAEYPDARTIPGIGPRLASLGCSSMATLPLPDGGRLLLDSSKRAGGGGWIERARPYLALLSVMAGPEIPSGGALRSHEEVASLRRAFSLSQEVLTHSGPGIRELLEGVREAIHADELYLLVEGRKGIEIVAAPARRRVPALPRDLQASLVLLAGAGVDEETLDELAGCLGMSSRAIAAAYGRESDGVEVLAAGWASGPALSTVSMSVVARLVSTAAAALRSRRRAVSSLVERERSRIAYALHDGLTQAVAGSVLELEALRRRIERDPGDAVDTLETSKAEIRRSLADLRAMLADLLRPEDAIDGPTEPLASYLEDVVKRWRLPARTSVQGDLSTVPAPVLSVAYVVLRETLANAAKHAPGTSVSVELAAGPTELTVVVADSGRGFTPQEELEAREGHHFGLQMLRHRVSEVGGVLQVQSRPGSGTRVVAHLPLHEVAS